MLNQSVRVLLVGLIVYLIAFSSGALRTFFEFFTLVLLTTLFLFFLFSLRAESTPIITRYALLMDAEDSKQERRYTRVVTWVWVMFFLILLFVKTGVSERGPLFGDFAHTDLIFYIGSVGLFVGEFYIRQWFLPAHRGSSLFRFLSKLSQISLKRVWQFDTKV